jgi:hypothetical protein
VSEIEAIRVEAQRRGITRLAHFTPLRNLVHIATGDGLLSTKYLAEHERSSFTVQDLERLDGYPDHISCSIEYPNAYYVRNKRRDARGEARIFPDWVCLLLDPSHLWRDTTLLCPHNAAGMRGANVAGGADAFRSMFADVVDAPQRRWHRSRQPACSPTDAQAEVLVHRAVPFDDLQAVAVESAAQAGDVWARLKQIGAPVERLAFLVAPAFFAATDLAVGLSQGRRPVESTWHPPGDGAHGDDG